MKVVNKQGKLAALALALGFVVCANPSGAWADSTGDTDRMKRTFSNGVVAISEGNFDIAGCSAYQNFTAPMAMLYMRGQTPWSEAPFHTVEAAEEQANAMNPGNAENKDKSFWASPYYMSFVGRSNAETTAVKADDFKMKRVGFMGGVEKNFTARTKAGFFMGYSRVEMTQAYYVHSHYKEDTGRDFDIVNHRFDPEIDAVDFTFGGSLAHTFANEWTVNTILIGGAQNYAWSRLASVDVVRNNGEVDVPQNYAELYQGGTTGNTLSVNVELSKNYAMGAGWTLTPALGIESAHSWIWQGEESGGDDAAPSELRSLGCDEDWSRWGLDDDVVLSRTTGRVGATLAYADENWGFNGKAFYGTVLGDQARYGAQKDGVSFSSNEVGVGYGNDTLKLGGGLWMALNQEKTTTIGGSYEAVLYKRATSQLACGTFITRF
ncbi:MAG: autotransporter outer membrane beta-barrel domain-containing protein [Thermoguttaceae bacterium]|nr:autotransporter outer membrane beta-barrel domain-containing protein [Thermoguttaceae bacterium]